MTKIEGYVLFDRKQGTKYEKIYMDRASANIGIEENYSKEDIVEGIVKIVPINIVSYVDLRSDIKVKNKCHECGGLGQIKKNREVVEKIRKEKTEDKKKSKSKKKEEVEEFEEVKKVVIENVVCPVCNGTKEIWVPTRAIVIY